MAKEPVTQQADRAWRSYCERNGYANVGDSTARELFKSGFIAAIHQANDSRRHAQKAQSYQSTVSPR